MTRRYRRYRYDDEDDDGPLDANGVLKDGCSVTVPLHMMDSMQRDIARHSLATRLHDGHGGPAGHRPGFVYSTDASLNEAKERAYAAYDAELRDAYKHPQGWRGDIDASDGTLDATPVLDERERAYAAYDAAVANAWRGPRDSVKW
jgi:hypothetical protein